MNQDSALIQPSDDADALRLLGDWRVHQAARLERTLRRESFTARRLDGRGIEHLDAAGALMLLRLADLAGVQAEDVMLREEHVHLFGTVAASLDEDEEEETPVPAWQRGLARIGATVVKLGQSARELLGFFGLTLLTWVKVMPRPSQWRVTATVHHMQQSGLDALPLVALLSFLVGAVVAFLGATVLREFGAELFVVDLTTFAFLREFGVLLTAILLAGRTASAYTAQIGTMKSREEIDAIRTLGQDPIVLLVLPRLIALLIMLPILSVVATLAGLLGGFFVAVFSLGIPAELFVARAQEASALNHYLTGLAKAPLFAIVIALIGCLEGFKVTGTAQSVGERTTSAVVQCISTVIIIDALAAVFFMEMGW